MSVRSRSKFGNGRFDLFLSRGRKSLKLGLKRTHSSRCNVPLSLRTTITCYDTGQYDYHVPFCVESGIFRVRRQRRKRDDFDESYDHSIAEDSHDFEESHDVEDSVDFQDSVDVEEFLDTDS